MKEEQYQRANEIINEIKELENNISTAQRLKEAGATTQWFTREIGSLYLFSKYSRVSSSKILDNYIEDLTEALSKLKKEFSEL